MPHRFRTLALILAGGKGSRLGPLTQQRAKPALPYAGVYRLVDFPLTNCVHSQLNDVWLIEQFQPHALNEHLLNGRPWDLDRNAGGLRVMPPFTGGRGAGFAEGNADVLWRHRALLREYGADEIVVMSADHVERVDLRDVLDDHRAAKAAVTMVVTEVAAEAERFGLVQLDDATGRVTDWRYKTKEPFGRTAATEIFAYDARALLDTLEQLAGEVDKDDDGEPQFEDFGDHLIPALVQQGHAHAWRHDGYWRDVGTVPSYWEGHMDLLRDDLAGPGGALALDDPRWPLRTGAVLHMPARFARSAYVDDALVSPGCVIAGRVERSVLGPGVVVEEGAEVCDSVLLHAGVVRRGAHVHRAVLDTHVDVGAEARVGTGGDAELTVVGRRVRVDAGAELTAGAQVDAAGGGGGGEGGVDLGSGVHDGARA